MKTKEIKKSVKTNKKQDNQEINSLVLFSHISL